MAPEHGRKTFGEEQPRGGCSVSCSQRCSGGRISEHVGGSQISPRGLRHLPGRDILTLLNVTSAAKKHQLKSVLDLFTV